MKKLLLSALSLSLCLSGFAQNNQQVTIKDLRPLPNYPAKIHHDLKVSGDEQVLKNNANSNSNSKAPVHPQAKISALYQQTIGNTTYDLQTNGTVVAARLYNVGNEIAAAWTFSTDLGGTYPDRGTVVNRSTDNGQTWGPQPAVRIESKRQGFGSMDRLGAGEVVVSHAAGAPLTCWHNPSAAAPVWDSTMIPYPAGMGYPLWNSMKVGGNNGYTLHMVTATAPAGQTPPGAPFNGMDGAMIYYRSLDSGYTWSAPIQLPESDTSAASPYLNFRANSYAVDVKGDVVAIVAGSITSDWSLWKSTDNGSTWTRTVIQKFYKPKYDYLTMDTDTDLDGNADTIPCTDASYAVVLDNNGMAHCFAGAMFCLEVPGSGALNYFPGTNGLLYWNEGMGTSPPVVCAQATTAAGFAPDLGAQYGDCGICSMPTAGVDPQNNIYVAYSNLKDGTDNGASGTTLDFSYRNVWAQALPVGNTTWNPPYALLSDNFTEEVYPSAARDVDNPNCFHVAWQADPTPGYSVPTNGQQTTIASSDIVYECVEPNPDLGIILGVNEVKASTFGVSVSPNPATDLVLINYHLEKSDAVKLNISDAQGKSVYNYATQMAEGKSSISVNLKNFSAGVYTVNTDIGTKNYSSKFVVK